MKDNLELVRLPSSDESIAPVTIFDAQGNVLRVVSAADFRQAHPTGATSRSQPAAARRQYRTS